MNFCREFATIFAIGVALPSVNNTGGKLTSGVVGVVGTGCKFTAGVVDIGVHIFPEIYIDPEDTSSKFAAVLTMIARSACLHLKLNIK